MGWSQGEEELKENAETLFAEEKYEEAFAKYSQLLALKLQSPEYNFRFGACQLFTSSEKEQALKYLKYAVESEEPPNLANFYYGFGLHLNYRFEKAIKFYERYKASASKKDKESILVDHYIEQCNSGIDLVSNFTNISVINRETLPRTEFYRNYDLNEFGGKIMVKPEDFMSDEDKDRDAKFLMYFQKEADYIYYGSYSKKNETGKDLYVIQKLPTGDWSQPQRLSSVINTPYDEDYPFIHPGGSFLYFASKGHNSMGGYDIFKSTRKGDGTWTQPINMEFAINTPWDDFMFISDKDEKMAWFSSNRETSSNQVSVYQIGMERVPLDLTIIKGTFTAEGSKKAKITVEDVVQNKTVGVFESERQFGGYLIDIKGSGQYKFIIKAEESNAIHTGLVEIPRDKGLKQFRQEMTLLNNDGKEQLQIINHFDEPLEESLFTAEILRKQASLAVNSSEDDLRTTEILDESIASETQTEYASTTDELIKEVEKLQEQLVSEADLLNEKTALLYNTASQESSSTDPKELAEASLAGKLAIEYKNEADLRQNAAASLLRAIEEARAGAGNSSIAALNQSKAKGENFQSVEGFENKLASSFEIRSEPLYDIYKNKLQELDEISSDIAGIDEEISYYDSEIENTKDEAIIKELKVQKQNAAAARPEKEAALARAEKELSVAERVQNNASSYSALVTGLIEGTVIAASNISTGSTSNPVSASAIITLQGKLATKTSNDPALIAFISPEFAQEASDAALAKARKDAPGETQAMDGIISNENMNSSSQDEIAALSVNDDSESSDDEPENLQNDTQTKNDEDLAISLDIKDLNDNIRVIEAVESKPEIIGGNYDIQLQQALDEIEEDDPIIEESKKAEIYDQWVDNVQYRIDSLTSTQGSTTNVAEKLQIGNEIKTLEQKKNEKSDLALEAYSNIATLSDAQAESAALASESSLAESTSLDTESQVTDNLNNAGNLSESEDSRLASVYQIENGTSGKSSNESFVDESNLAINEGIKTNDGPSENGSKPITPGTPESFESINTNYKVQIAEMNSSDSPYPLDNEIAINKAWANTLQQELIVLGDKISKSETNAERYELEDLAAEIRTQKQKRETRAAQLQSKANNSQLKEEYAKSSAELQTQLNTLIESYNNTSFLKIEQDLESIKDTIERSAKQELLYQNWLIGLKNEEYKTETRLSNTQDANQIADLNEKLVQIYAEKAYVQASLAQNSATSGASLNSPKAPETLVIKGAERFEGYESVGSENPAEYDQKAQNSYTAISEQETKIVKLETKLVNAKKKEKPAIELELEEAQNQLELLELESKFYEAAKPKILTVEQVLLQKSADMQLASNKQILEAQVINEEAEKLEVVGEEKRKEATLIKKKKDIPAAQKAVREAEHMLALKKLEADLAFKLADEMKTIETQAIAQNFIIPGGEATALPVVTSKLNPTEQADVAQTEQFAEYNKQIRRVDSLQTLAASLAQLERSHTEQAQAILEGSLSDVNNNSDNSASSSIKRTQQAFVLYEKADSTSATVAKLKRQAAFIENKANIALLKNPEQVYTPILAYYNSDNEYTTSADIQGNETAVATDGTSMYSMPIDGDDKVEDFALTPPKENNRNVEVQEDILTNTIFELDDTPTNAYYSESSPIPIDPELPNGILFKVQIGAFRNQIMQDAFKGIKPITGEITGTGFTRYTAGAFSKFAEAGFAKDEIRGIGYQDAFVVAYKDGKRISVGAAQSAIASGEPVAYTRPQGRNDRSSTESIKSNNNPANTDVTPSDLVNRGALKVVSVNDQEGVFYTVQVGVYSKPITSDDIFGLTPLNVENLPNGNYRYSNGVFKDFIEADRVKEEIRAIGVEDAFVTAYSNGNRLTFEEAQKQLGQSSNTTENPIETSDRKYRILLGTFAGQVPVAQARVILSLSSDGVDKAVNGDGSNTYYYGLYNDQESASALVNDFLGQGLNQAKVIEK